MKTEFFGGGCEYRGLLERLEELVKEYPGDRYELLDACEFSEVKSSLKESRVGLVCIFRVGGLGLVCIF